MQLTQFLFLALHIILQILTGVTPEHRKKSEDLNTSRYGPNLKELKLTAFCCLGQHPGLGKGNEL